MANNEAWYLIAPEQVLEALQVSSLKDGLTSDEVAIRTKQYGPNALKNKKNIIPLWIRLLVRHSLNFMVLVLLVACVLSFVVREWVDGSVIAFVILLNIFIGFIQEFRSEKTMEKLVKMTASKCRVTRNGHKIEVETSELVPGDVVSLKMGDQVPADLRIIHANNLECNEALLTGESVPVKKESAALERIVGPSGDNAEELEDIPLGDRKNMAFMNTSVAKGKGVGIVVATGMKTEMGKIAKLLSKAKKGSANSSKMQLQSRMNKLSIVLVIASIIALGLVLLCVWLYGSYAIYPDGLKFGLTIAVAIIPESMTAVIAVTISIGVRQMAKANAIVRKLSALEGLGSVTDICSDKTGTLTEGKMSVRDIWVVGGHNYSVTGDSVVTTEQIEVKSDTPNSEKELEEVIIDEKVPTNGLMYEEKPVTELPDAIKMLVTIGALCNTSHVRIDPETNQQQATGDATEIALNNLSQKLNLSKDQLVLSYPNMVYEHAFDSTVKRMSAIYSSNKSNELIVLSKGAPNYIVDFCTSWMHDPDATSYSANTEIKEMTEEIKEQISNAQNDLAAHGMRVLAFAYKTLPANTEQYKLEHRNFIESELTFVGLVGIQDPPRQGVAEAVRTCREAGITVRMVTGDHHDTARAIAKQIGIITDEEHDVVMKATEFDHFTDDQLKTMEKPPVVIARCSPQTKVKLVNALHGRNENKLVAMTGDGVNDAPAISTADVGIAMGQNGADVTKESSDIVLTDDNFVTIVAAIKEGRRIFDNIRKFVIFMLSGNVSQATSLLIPVFLGLPVPLNPIQILWMNLITGTPPALALGVEPASQHIMNKKKRRAQEPLWSLETIVDTLVFGMLAGGITLLVYFLMTIAWLNRPIESVQAVSFTTLVFILLFHSYICRNKRKPFFMDRFWRSYWIHLSILLGIALQCAILYIPYVNSYVFHQNPMAGDEWPFVIVAVIVFMAGCEIYKFIKVMFIKLIGNRIDNKWNEYRLARKKRALNKKLQEGEVVAQTVDVTPTQLAESQPEVVVPQAVDVMPTQPETQSEQVEITVATF